MAQDDEDEKIRQAHNESLRKTIEALRKGNPGVARTPRDLAEQGAREAREENQGTEEGHDREPNEKDLDLPLRSEDKE
jgi:hypothetical protein